MFAAGYGWFNSGGAEVNINCATASTYCMGAEEESTNDLADYSSDPPNISNIMGAAVYTKSNNTISGYINGVNLFNHSPASDTNTGLGCPCTFKPGRAIHFGGGGDLSQPDAFIAREMMILNLAMTNTQYQAIFSNVQVRYPSLTFLRPLPR